MPKQPPIESAHWDIQVHTWEGMPNTPEQYQEEAYLALEELGKLLRDFFRDVAPEKTGNLKKKLTYRRSKKGGKLLLEVVMPWYGRLTIEGFNETRYPLHSKYLKIELKGGEVLYRKSAGPIKAEPWHLAVMSHLNTMQELATKKAMLRMWKRLEKRAGKGNSK